MDLWQAILLGILQGITEFFPVSSSTHLKIAENFLGLKGAESLLFFDLSCHLGTLLALFFFLKEEIWAILQDRAKVRLFILALLPLVPMYLAFKPLKLFLLEIHATGPCLILSGLFLLFAQKQALKPAHASSLPFSEGAAPPKTLHVLCIGCMQAMALFPGISRSGITIATARTLGWSWHSGAKFSFLLSIPAILGGMVLESRKLLTTDFSSIPLSCFFAGIGTSFLFGLLGIRVMFICYKQAKIRPFAGYCILLGTLLWWFSRG